MPTVTVEPPVEQVTEAAQWLAVVQAEFKRAVLAITGGAVPGSLKPSGNRLTHGEWLAVLEAARREVITAIESAVPGRTWQK